MRGGNFFFVRYRYRYVALLTKMHKISSDSGPLISKNRVYVEGSNNFKIVALAFKVEGKLKLK